VTEQYDDNRCKVESSWISVSKDNSFISTLGTHIILICSIHFLDVIHNLLLRVDVSSKSYVTIRKSLKEKSSEFLFLVTPLAVLLSMPFGLIAALLSGSVTTPALSYCARYLFSCSELLDQVLVRDDHCFVLLLFVKVVPAWRSLSIIAFLGSEKDWKCQERLVTVVLKAKNEEVIVSPTILITLFLVS